PGLNRVQFLDGKTGYAAGDGTEQYPSGLFQTVDGGQTWQMVPGPTCPTWLAAEFSSPGTGVLAGAWGRLSVLRKETIVAADVDPLGARAVLGLQVMGNRAIAVGQRGLVLHSNDSAGSRWGYADLKLPAAISAAWDFRGVHCRGDHVWIVGRPGS